MKPYRSIAVALLAAAGAQAAEPAVETLIQEVPAGYRLGFQTRQGNVVMTGMLRDGEAFSDWTELVTTHVFVGRKDTTPEDFQLTMAKGWLGVCKNGTVSRVNQGEEYGYPFSVWVQTCPVNPMTGRPENTWFKAIKGNDSFYLVQKSFRFEPSDEQVRQWLAYFRSIRLCDPRIAERQCPKAAAPQQRT